MLIQNFNFQLRVLGMLRGKFIDLPKYLQIKRNANSQLFMHQTKEAKRKSAN